MSDGSRIIEGLSEATQLVEGIHPDTDAVVVTTKDGARMTWTEWTKTPDGQRFAPAKPKTDNRP